MRCADSFGNRLSSSSGESAFVVDVKGPDTMMTHIVDCGDGTVEVRCAAAATFAGPAASASMCMSTPERPYTSEPGGGVHCHH